MKNATLFVAYCALYSMKGGSMMVAGVAGREEEKDGMGCLPLERTGRASRGDG